VIETEKPIQFPKLSSEKCKKKEKKRKRDEKGKKKMMS